MRNVQSAIDKILEQYPFITECSNETRTRVGFNRIVNDGYWFYLADGYIDPNAETHFVHEYTLADCRKALANVKRCYCDECNALRGVSREIVVNCTGNLFAALAQYWTMRLMMESAQTMLWHVKTQHVTAESEFYRGNISNDLNTAWLTYMLQTAAMVDRFAEIMPERGKVDILERLALLEGQS